MRIYIRPAGGFTHCPECKALRSSLQDFKRDGDRWRWEVYRFACAPSVIDHSMLTVTFLGNGNLRCNWDKCCPKFASQIHGELRDWDRDDRGDL